MLRLASFENKELKDSLRYVEIQYAKTEKELRVSNQRFADSQTEIANLHDQISRQANISHSQVQQIEEMAERLADVDNI